MYESQFISKNNDYTWDCLAFSESLEVGVFSFLALRERAGVVTIHENHRIKANRKSQSKNQSRNTMAEKQNKRARADEVTVDDVLFHARFIFGCDPFKESAPKTEDKRFRALFGCCPEVVLILWNLIDSNEALPCGGRIIHLLWALLFVKVYPTEETLVKLCKGDPSGASDRKTTRKWIRLFMQAICCCIDDVVSD